MDNSKTIQDDYFESSTPGIKNIQQESTNTEKDQENLQDSDILDLLQLDEISPEDDLDCGELPPYSEKSYHININKNREVNRISFDSYDIEECINSKEVQKEIKISVGIPEKKIISETVDCVYQVLSTSSSKELEKIKNLTNKNIVDYKKGIQTSSMILREEKINKKITRRTELLSSEVANKFLNDLINRKIDSEICTSDKDIQSKDQSYVCYTCGFESDNVEARIKHLKTYRHLSNNVQKRIEHLKSQIISLQSNNESIILKYSERFSNTMEHVNSARQIGVQEAKKAIMCGILVNYTIDTFYCTACNWFVTDFEPLIEHILSINHTKAVFVSLYTKLNKGILTSSCRGKEYCSVCKCYIPTNRENIYNHLKSKHMENWELPHCAMCGDTHPNVLDISSLYTHTGPKKGVIAPLIKIRFRCESNLNFKEMSENSLLKTKEMSENHSITVINNSQVDPKNDEWKNKSRQRSNKSKRLTRRYGSRSPTHRKYDSGISNTKIPIERDPIKQMASKSPLKKTSTTENKQRIAISNTSLSDVDSDDQDEELNIITSIVKLLSLSYLLGNLGYFLELTLNKALERKEFTDDVLDTLKEPANIILMEVILKKLNSFDKSILSRSTRKVFIKGIMYLTYLIDASNSSQSVNFPQDSSLILDSSSLPLVRSSTSKNIISTSSSVPVELMASNWPSVSSKSKELCHGLNVKEIAKVTADKNVEFTVDFIKSSLKDINRTPTAEVISDIVLALSAEHFKILSDL